MTVFVMMMTPLLIKVVMPMALCALELLEWPKAINTVVWVWPMNQVLQVIIGCSYN